MKEKIKGAIKIFLACWLVQFVIGWIAGGVYGTVVQVNDSGFDLALGVGLAIIVGIAAGLIFLIKALFGSGISNFQD